jgi:hypothetical protein
MNKFIVWKEVARVISYKPQKKRENAKRREV